MKVYQKIFAIIFMIALMGFSVCNMIFKFSDIKEDFLKIEKPDSVSDAKKYTASIDNVFIENLLFDHSWNEAYAKVYDILGKNEENSFAYVRDKNNMLYAGNFWNLPNASTKDYINRMLELKKQAEEIGAKLVVLLYPCLYNEAWTDGYYGIPYTDYNQLGDEMTAYFRYYGIDFIDYRDVFIEQGKTAEEIFFRTDHHWTIQTAFDAFVELTNHLNEEYEENLDMYYTDKSNYEYVTYENIYIGSQGRDAGVNYVGADDFTYILPKFKSSYSCKFTYSSDKIENRQGSMQDVLINTRVAEKEDYYDREMYAAYMDGVRMQDYIVNNNNPEGLNVLFIRDSFSSPLATFFSSYCNTMDMYWSVQNDAATMEQAVENGEYDYIFVGLAIDSYANYGFEIYKEAGTNE